MAERFIGLRDEDLEDVPPDGAVDMVRELVFRYVDEYNATFHNDYPEENIEYDRGMAIQSIRLLGDRAREHGVALQVEYYENQPIDDDDVDVRLIGDREEIPDQEGEEMQEVPEGEMQEQPREEDEPMEVEGGEGLEEVQREGEDVDLPEEVEHRHEEEIEPRPGPREEEVEEEGIEPPAPPPPGNAAENRDGVIHERNMLDNIFNTGGVYDPDLEKTMRRRMGALGDLSSTHRPIRQTPSNTDILGHHSVKGQLGMRGIMLGTHFMLRTDSVPEVNTNPIKSIRTKYYKISKINRNILSFLYNG